ncbi:peptidase M23, partial [Mesorhizobium sp. M7A.F.Ca.MR.362.00.0.0]
MATTLRTIIFVLLFALITQIQFNLDADKTATRQLKNATEIAVHDAGLAV